MADDTPTRATRPGAAAAGWRLLAALLALVASVGTTLVFLLVAYIGATNNCEDGCPVGSRWAPGAWGSIVEPWGLAVPAVIAAFPSSGLSQWDGNGLR